MSKTIGESAWERLRNDAYRMSGEDGDAVPTWVDAVLWARERIAELEAAVLREKRRVDSLHECINEREAQLDEAREDWAREFQKRGSEVAAVARESAILAIALMRLRDEGDQLYPNQIKHIAIEALRAVYGRSDTSRQEKEVKGE